MERKHSCFYCQKEWECARSSGTSRGKWNGCSCDQELLQEEKSSITSLVFFCSQSCKQLQENKNEEYDPSEYNIEPVEEQNIEEPVVPEMSTE